jgi:hypothetical protein
MHTGAVIYREAGADVITPDANVNRNLGLLKEIKEATVARLKYWSTKVACTSVPSGVVPF